MKHSKLFFLFSLALVLIVAFLVVFGSNIKKRSVEDNLIGSVAVDNGTEINPIHTYYGDFMPTEAQWVDLSYKYPDSSLGFNVEYPIVIDLEVLDSDDGNLNGFEAISGVRMTYIGKTQKAGTELYDGISLQIFNLGTLPQDKTIQQIAQSEIDSSLDFGSQLLSGPTAVVIDEYDAISYTMQGLGVFEHTFVTDGENLYRIVLLVADPNNQGYQEVTDRIISSFEIT